MGSSRNCGPKCAALGVNSCSTGEAVTLSRSMLSEETLSSVEVEVFDLVPTRLHFTLAWLKDRRPFLVTHYHLQTKELRAWSLEDG
jgi:hypothetical protein